MGVGYVGSKREVPICKPKAVRTTYPCKVFPKELHRILLSDDIKKGNNPYGNLVLKTSVEEILGYTVAIKLNDEQLECAALDAIASLKLHGVLVKHLVLKSD
ncbi:hypothetical protein B0H19DRAFT_1058637 [Mycena capillaripes]|nr:hypothetical protein B0H19DRAFT_1058637 [Mycena capillaripes]